MEELLKDLVSLADFDREDAPIYDRAMGFYLSKTIAVFGGLQFLLMMEWGLSGQEFWRALWLSLGISIIGGVLFAGLMYVTTVPSLRRKLRDRLTRIFAGDPALVPPPPRDATHRLICGLIFGRTRAGGAILYVRPRGLTLQLNYPAARWWQRRPHVAPQPLEIGPPQSIVLNHGIWLPAWWHRVLVRHTRVVLLIRWPEGTIALRVPLTSEVRARLQACIDDLRTYPGSAQAAI